MNARVNHLLNEVLYRTKEITPQGMVHFHIEYDASHHRIWVVSSQMLSERSKAESGSVSLFADAEGNESAQDTFKRQGIHTL